MSEIAEGALARAGLVDADWVEAAENLLREVQSLKLETLRVLFADQHGVLRGKTLVIDALASLFANGMAAPSTLLLKDTSHRTAFPVWSPDAPVAGNLRGAGDILMIPDPASFRVLPWSGHSAWILCDLAYVSGEQMPFCTRSILRRAEAQLAQDGFELTVGLEVEFHVFEMVDPKLEHADASMPGAAVETRNITQGYQFLTETRFDAMEGVMDLIRRACQQMGLPIRSMEVEMGPSQIELTFDPASAMAHADNMVMLRTAVKEICQRQGLHATFMCKPAHANAAASGWHLHQSLIERSTGAAVFVPQAGEVLSPHCASWVAGLLAHAREGCLLATPTVNGYKRYLPGQLAPNSIAWARDNRGAMIRALTAPDHPASRIENRVAEPTANPYLFFAGQIHAGLAGVQQGLSAPDPVENPYENNAEALPTNLSEAIAAFDGSAFFRAALGDDFVDYLCQIKRAEWERYQRSVSDWEQREYFGLF